RLIRHRRPSYPPKPSVRGSPLPRRLKALPARSVSGSRVRPRSSLPHVRDNTRRPGRCGADVSAPRIEDIRDAKPGTAGDGNGACFAGKAIFFSWGPPWRRNSFKPKPESADFERRLGRPASRGPGGKASGGVNRKPP